MLRRGNVAVGLTPLVALVLMVVTLFVFVSDANGKDDSSRDTAELIGEFDYRQKFVPVVFENMVEEAIEKSNDSQFRESFESNLRESANRRRDSKFGNIFIRIIDGIDGKDENYNLEQKGDFYELTIGNVFVEYEVDNNKLKRKFSLKIKFNIESIIGNVEVKAVE